MRRQKRSRNVPENLENAKNFDHTDAALANGNMHIHGNGKIDGHGNGNIHVQDNHMDELVREFQLNPSSSLHSMPDSPPPPRPPARAVLSKQHPPPKPPKPSLPDGLYSVALQSEPTKLPMLVPTKVPIPIPPGGGILKNNPNSRGAQSQNSVDSYDSRNGNRRIMVDAGFRHSSSENNYKTVRMPEQVGIVRQSPSRNTPSAEPFPIPTPARKSQSFYMQTSV